MWRKGHLERYSKSYIEERENFRKSTKCSTAEASKESAFSTTDVNENLQYADDTIVDSGAMVHRTNTSALYEEPKLTPDTSKSTVNGAYILAICEGSSTVRFGSRKSGMNLNRILYVPQISEDLISVSQICDAGYHVTENVSSIVETQSSEKDIETETSIEYQ